MNTKLLRELAQLGVRQKVRAIERQIADLQAEFPDLFISAGRVVLLKADVREAGGGDWPIGAPPEAEAEASRIPRRKAIGRGGRSAPGSAAARVEDYVIARGPVREQQIVKATTVRAPAAGSALRRAEQRGLLQRTPDGWTAVAAATGPAKGTRKSATRTNGSGKGHGRKRRWKERWYEHLQAVAKPERAADSARALGTSSASLLTSSKAWIAAGVIKRQDDGRYAVGDAPPAP